jgi:hypothetical protein
MLTGVDQVLWRPGTTRAMTPHSMSIPLDTYLCRGEVAGSDSRALVADRYIAAAQEVVKVLGSWGAAAMRASASASPADRLPPAAPFPAGRKR